MTTSMHEFADGAALAEALARAVADALAAGIEARGEASIAVSGGSTPKAFFKALSGKPIDWARVTITLVDERFVPADNPRSNHLLVADNLLQDKAKAAGFLPPFLLSDLQARVATAQASRVASTSAILRAPSMAMVRTVSHRRRSSARATPGSPAAARP